MIDEKTTAREILDELINQVIAETVGHFEDKYGVCEQLQRQALTDLSELVMGEKVDITGFTLGNGKDSEEHIRCAVQNYTCDHIAKLFATDKEGK